MAQALAVFPLLCFVFLFCRSGRSCLRASGRPCWRRAFLAASVVWAVILTAITEILSLFGALTLGWLAGSWILACVIAGSPCLPLVRQLGFFTRPDGRPRGGHEWPRYRKNPGQGIRDVRWRPILELPTAAALLLGATAAIITTVGIDAVVAAPNGWDSMTYHMGRVVHWMQDATVALYPASAVPQLYQPPWAEFVILHLQILSGGDHLANLVQWFSMVGSVIGVSVLAQQLGADRFGQVLAAVCAVTVPMGLVQATGTQNVYVVTFWLVCCVHYFLMLRADPSAAGATSGVSPKQAGYPLGVVPPGSLKPAAGSPKPAAGSPKPAAGYPASLGFGASLGLALLTKGTTYVYILPFLLWFALWGVKTLRRSVWKPALILAVSALLINLGYYLRNAGLYGNPLGPDLGIYANGVLSLPGFLSNLIRNLSLHLGTPFRPVDLALRAGIERLHGVLGVSVNDPRTTWHGTVFHINPLSTDETIAGNPLHLLLIAVVTAVCPIARTLRRQTIVVQYLLAVTGGFLLFCLDLKWQPWNSRLHLPFFILFCPLCGIALARARRARLGALVGATLLIASLPWVMYGQNRPLLGSRSVFITARVDQYFADRPWIEGSYVDAARYLRTLGCTNFGFAWNRGPYEYPFWALLNQISHRVRIQDVEVRNNSTVLSRRHPYDAFHPCAVAASDFGWLDRLDDNGYVYRRSWASGPVTILTRAQAIAGAQTRPGAPSPPTPSPELRERGSLRVAA